jgi:serine/threonine-protein phosphatase Stp1
LSESAPFVPDGSGQQLRFRSAARSDSGPIRRLNEDRFVDLSSAGLWAVADGMGGHEAGDVAAEMVASAVMGAASDSPVKPEAVRDAVGQVNCDLTGQTAQRGTSGSTIVALIAGDDGRFACLWAGDSRAYVYRDGGLLPLTRDHSFVQELVEAGLLSRTEARNHPRANVITRAVGVADDLQLESAEGAMWPGDIFLLCSDGLTGALDEERIASFLADGDLDRAADRLLAAAVTAPALDNVTFVLVAVG